MCPFDSNGVFSLTPGYTAVAGQTIQPSQHNPPLEDLASSGLSLVLVRDGRAPMTGNLNMNGFKLTNVLAGTNALDAVNKTQLDLNSPKLSIKNTNYAAVAADKATVFLFTAAATLSLSAAATLGAGWVCRVYASAGDVTITPNGTEQINGVNAPYILYSGSEITIYCDGTGFYIPANNGWNLISAVTLSSPAPTIDFINKLTTRFDRYRIEIDQVFPVSNTVSLQMQISTNGGSSWLSAGYLQAALVSSTTTPTTGENNLSNWTLTQVILNTSGNGANGFAEVTRIAGATSLVSTVGGITTGSTLRMEAQTGLISGTADSLRFLFNSGNMATGSRIRLYGMAK